MTEDKTVETVEDVGPSEAVETSTNEETQDVESKDADDLSFADLDLDDESDETEETEAATEESEEVEEESTEDVEDDKGEEPEKPSTDEEQKRIAHEAFLQREAARKAKQEELRGSQEQYLQGAEDDKDLALRQLQVDAYNNRIQINADKLESGIRRSIAEIDLFRTGPDEVKEALVQSLDEFEQLYVTKNKHGDPIEVRADINKFLHQRAEMLRKVMQVGARQEVKAKSKTQARTTVTPSKPPREPKVDKDEEDFDRVFA